MFMLYIKTYKKSGTSKLNISAVTVCDGFSSTSCGWPSSLEAAMLRWPPESLVDADYRLESDSASPWLDWDRWRRYCGKFSLVCAMSETIDVADMETQMRRSGHVREARPCLPTVLSTRPSGQDQWTDSWNHHQYYISRWVRVLTECMLYCLVGY